MMHSRPFTLVVILMVGFIYSCGKNKDKSPPSSNNTITSFGFLVNRNPALPQDIIGEIDQDTIRVVIFPGTDVQDLKADFVHAGNVITVGDLPQVSGQSGHDFNQHIEYKVTAADGQIMIYQVKIEDTGLPLLSISTNGLPVESKEQYVSGYMQVKANRAGDSLFGGSIEIRGRGNSTWGMPKKPYKIKLGKKAGLLGMHDSKQWVLLANYTDKSLLRNELAFELSRRLQLAYTPSSSFVDVVLNGQYIGNYQLVDQIEVDGNKVNIEKQPVNASTFPEIKGGYLVEVDGFAQSEKIHFTTARSMMVSVHYPKDDEISAEQVDYITTHFQQFEDRLFADNFSDPSTGYQAYFDLDSYVNWFIVNEVLGNPDIFWSTYMYKSRNSDKLFTGPVWDLDIAANNDYRIGDATQQLMVDVAHEPKLWIKRLMNDPAFRHAVRDRWNLIKQDKVFDLPQQVDQLSLPLHASQKKNFQKWPILSQKVWLNLQAAGTYPGELVYLKDFLTKRIAWLDATFNGIRFD